MPAARCNYIVVYKDDSQIYATGTKEIALSSPPPPGVPLEHKQVMFITYRPDEGVLAVHEIPQDEVLAAEIKHVKRKSKEEKEEELADV